MSSRIPYFASQVHCGELLEQLAAWRGTRWQHAGTRPNEMKCGVSGDCLFWVHAFKAIGALPAKLQIPDYRMMEARADKMKTLRTCIEATEVADLVWERKLPGQLFYGPKDKELFRTNYRQNLETLVAIEPMVGDVFLFKNGTSGAHCGLCVRTVPTHFMHLCTNGLIEEPLGQAHYIRDTMYVYRLMEPAAAEVPA